MGDVV